MPGRSGLLRERDFRLLWSGITLSELATQSTVFVLPLLAVTVLHAGPLQVGLVSSASTAAFLLVGLPIGAWVDRTRRRRLLLLGDLGRVALLGSVGVLAYLGDLTLSLLYVVALGCGVLSVFFDVADQSYLPHVTGKDRLVEGNATIAATKSVSQVSGPGLGGLLAHALAGPWVGAAGGGRQLPRLWRVGERNPLARAQAHARPGSAFRPRNA